jgi:heat shock protein HtpX
LYEQIASNKRKSYLLFFGFLVLYGLLGYGLSYVLGGPVAFLLVAGVAIGMTVTALYGGDDLAVKVAGGVQVTKAEAPELYRMVENLAITAGVPMPRLYISADPSANAFAAGRNPEQAIVCVNQGLLDVLDDMELQGVLAHEMSHIRNYDVRLMTYAAVLAGSIALIAQLASYAGFFGGGNRDNNNNGGGNNWIGIIVFLAAIILAPIAATIIQLTISRKREYVADAAAVELTRYPGGLASALRVISGDDTPPLRDERAIAHMMIAPQLTPGGHVSKLFATHPPTEDRIKRLEDMGSNVSHTRGLPVSQTFLEAAHAAEAAQASASAPQGFPPGFGLPGQ